MNIKKEYIIIAIITATLISISLVTSGMQSENTKVQKQAALFVAGQQGITINPEAIKNSISLYKNLSEDKKIAIKEKMAQKSQQRQKNIEAVEKQIKELRMQGKLQKPKNKEEQVSRLQEIQQLALRENATETAKSLASLINMYENNSQNDNNFEVE